MRRLFSHALQIFSVLCSVASTIALVIVLSGADGQPYVLAVQAAYPAFVLLAIIGVVAGVRRAPALGFGIAVLMLWGVLLGGVHLLVQPATNVQHGAFSVVAANLLYVNQQTETAVGELAAQEADVLITVETTPVAQTALIARGYRLAARGGMVGSDTVVWTTHQYRTLPPIVLHDRSLPVAEILLPGGPVIVVGVHLRSPTRKETLQIWKMNWNSLLPALRGLQGPVVVAGDFNSSRVHAPMLQLAESYDNSSALSILAPFHPTWPTTPYRWWLVRIPIFDLDHVLVQGVSVLGYGRFSIPGSDHLGVRANLSQVDPD